MKIIFIALLLANSIMSDPSLWSKDFGGENRDYVSAINKVKDGGYIITGETNSFGAVDTDVWLFKIDSMGNICWNRLYGGNLMDRGKSVIQTYDHGFIIAGISNSFSINSRVIWIIKTDSIGDTLWTKIYHGEYYDDVGSIKQMSDSGYIVIGSKGYFFQPYDQNWLIRLDKNGDSLWSKEIGGVVSDYGTDICITQDNKFAFVSISYSLSQSKPDIWIIKTNQFGDTIWTRNFISSADDYVRSIKTTRDNGFIITGSLNNKICLIKLDSTGQTIFNKYIDEEGICCGNTVQQTEDGGYFITGKIGFYTYTTVIIKTDSLGEIVWKRKYYEGITSGGVYGLSTTNNNYIFTGTYTSNMNVWITCADSNGLINIENKSVSSQLSSSYFKIHPTPFNPFASIKYHIAKSNHVKLEVYDIKGKLVDVLIDRYKHSGKYNIIWNAHAYCSGAYYFKFTADDFISVKKGLLIR